MTSGTCVVSVEYIPIQIPYRKPYRGAKRYVLGPCVLLIRLVDESGREGWGEIPIQYHPIISGEATQQLAEPLANDLVLHRPPRPRFFVATAANYGGWLWYPYLSALIASGFELALWDLLGRQLGVHVTELLGGRVRNSMECMYFLYDDTPEVMAEEAAEARRDGFRIIYLKWRGTDGEMMEKLNAVHPTLAPDGLFRIDPNESWTRASVGRHLKDLEAFPVEFIEQPLPRFDRCGPVNLRQRSSTAISGDQGTRMMDDVLAALADDGIDTLSVSASDAGGVIRALDIAAVTKAAGLPMSMHSNNETAIGFAAEVSIACMAESCTYASQMEYQFHEWDIAKGLTFDGAQLAVDWAAPGWGLTMDSGAIERAAANYQSGAVGAEPPDRTSPYSAMPAY